MLPEPPRFRSEVDQPIAVFNYLGARLHHITSVLPASRSFIRNAEPEPLQCRQNANGWSLIQNVKRASGRFLASSAAEIQDVAPHRPLASSAGCPAGKTPAYIQHSVQFVRHAGNISKKTPLSSGDVFPL